MDRGLPRTGGADQVAELAARTGLHGVFAPALLGDPDRSWSALRDGDRGGAGYGIGLLSRVAPVEVRRVALPGGGDGRRCAGASPRNPGWDHEPRVALVATLETAGGTLRVATAHLSYLPWRGLAQLRAAAAAVAALGGPAALLGDFNLPAWPVRLALPGHWTHVRSAPTYPAWRPRLAVDQLVVRGGLTVSDVAVAPPATSDHLPLLATVRLPTG